MLLMSPHTSPHDQAHDCGLFPILSGAIDDPQGILVGVIPEGCIFEAIEGCARGITRADEDRAGVARLVEGNRPG